MPKNKESEMDNPVNRVLDIIEEEVKETQVRWRGDDSEAVVTIKRSGSTLSITVEGEDSDAMRSVECYPKMQEGKMNVVTRSFKDQWDTPGLMVPHYVSLPFGQGEEEELRRFMRGDGVKTLFPGFDRYRRTPDGMLVKV